MSTAGHTGTQSSGRYNFDTAVCPHRLDLVLDLVIDSREIDNMHFRRRTRHRIHPVRHRVSRRALCLAASVMADCLARCENVGKIGETTNGKGRPRRKGKAYAPVTWWVTCGRYFSWGRQFLDTFGVVMRAPESGRLFIPFRLFNYLKDGDGSYASGCFPSSESA